MLKAQFCGYVIYAGGKREAVDQRQADFRAVSMCGNVIKLKRGHFIKVSETMMASEKRFYTGWL